MAAHGRSLQVGMVVETERGMVGRGGSGGSGARRIEKETKSTERRRSARKICMSTRAWGCAESKGSSLQGGESG